MPAEIDPVRLRDLLLVAFNEEGLKDLTFVLGIEYDDLSGGNRSAKARELVDFCRRDNRLEELLAAAEKLRPLGDWSSVRPIGPSTGIPATKDQTALDTLLSLQSLLSESKRALNEQKRLRGRLVALLRENRPGLDLDYEGQDDLFFQLYDGMNTTERDRFDDVRNSTMVLHDINVRTLDWVRKYPEPTLFPTPTPTGERLAKQLDLLTTHLNFWLARYDRVFAKDEKRALVFMADEKRRGPPWPFGLEPALRAAIREFKASIPD
jgi:hypothetical protein